MHQSLSDLGSKDTALCFKDGYGDRRPPDMADEDFRRRARPSDSRRVFERWRNQLLGHLGLIEWQNCVCNARSDLRDGDLQIISALQFLPQLRRCSEKAGKAQRHFSGYTAAAMHDFIDRADR